MLRLLFARCTQKAPMPFLLLLVIPVSLHAQDSLPPKQISYEVKLTERSGGKISGYLKQVTDSTVILSAVKTNYGPPVTANDKTLSYTTIKKLRFKRTNATGKGALIGGAIGLGTGLLVGAAASGGKADRGGFEIVSSEAAIGIGAILGGLAGTAIGAIAGASAWHKFEVAGSREGLAAVRLFLEQKVYGLPLPEEAP
ncbi:MAG TPA: hypothetical protein VMR70_04160 [Flavisolibacter sp.]|nr:hypothetical protein [Flavisolibacter sp.]